MPQMTGISIRATFGSSSFRRSLHCVLSLLNRVALSRPLGKVRCRSTNFKSFAYASTSMHLLHRQDEMEKSRTFRRKHYCLVPKRKSMIDIVGNQSKIRVSHGDSAFLTYLLFPPIIPSVLHSRLRLRRLCVGWLTYTVEFFTLSW